MSLVNAHRKDLRQSNQNFTDFVVIDAAKNTCFEAKNIVIFAAMQKSF